MAVKCFCCTRAAHRCSQQHLTSSRRRELPRPGQGFPAPAPLPGGCLTALQSLYEVWVRGKIWPKVPTRRCSELATQISAAFGCFCVAHSPSTPTATLAWALYLKALHLLRDCRQGYACCRLEVLATASGLRRPWRRPFINAPRSLRTCGLECCHCAAAPACCISCARTHQHADAAVLRRCSTQAPSWHRPQQAHSPGPNPAAATSPAPHTAAAARGPAAAPGGAIHKAASVLGAHPARRRAHAAVHPAMRSAKSCAVIWVRCAGCPAPTC